MDTIILHGNQESDKFTRKPFQLEGGGDEDRFYFLTERQNSSSADLISGTSIESCLRYPLRNLDVTKMRN